MGGKSRKSRPLGRKCSNSPTRQRLNHKAFTPRMMDRLPKPRTMSQALSILCLQGLHESSFSGFFFYFVVLCFSLALTFHFQKSWFDTNLSCIFFFHTRRQKERSHGKDTILKSIFTRYLFRMSKTRSLKKNTKFWNISSPLRLKTLLKMFRSIKSQWVS